MLTSVIKRGDVAAYRLVEQMLEDTTTGPFLRLGLAEDGFTYSETGDGLTPDMIAGLERAIDDVITGRVGVTTVPRGPVLVLDAEGNEVAGPEQAADLGLTFDGFVLGAAIEPGSYEITGLGTTLELTFAGEWMTPHNITGHTVFAAPGSARPGDRDVVFIRPRALADPTRPNAAPEAQDLWPPNRFDEWRSVFIDGVVVKGPEPTTIGGQTAVYFETEIDDDSICSAFGFCVGFVINIIDADGNVSGWSFEPGYRSRVWWVDQGTEPPLVIIASTPSTDRTFESTADALLATLVIGEPAPHPVDLADSGVTLNG